jgi:hypothetical protein
VGSREAGAVSAYGDTLARGKKIGASRAPTAEAIALFCDGPLQTLVGAVSPELVWTGAVARRMAYLEFGRLCAQPMEVSELQWLRTVIVTCERKRYRLVFSDLPEREFGPYDFTEVIGQIRVAALLSPMEARNLVLEALESGVSGRVLPERGAEE